MVRRLGNCEMIPTDTFVKRISAECFIFEFAANQIQSLNKCSVLSSSMHLVLAYLSRE
jgi:hypothetical protein